jgi:maleate isomerase
LIAQDQLIGWISVHYVPSTRVWSEGDIAALQGAVAHVTSVLRENCWTR